MFSRNSSFVLLRRYEYNYEISFFVEKHFRKKHFRKHYIRFMYLSIARFFVFDIILIYFNQRSSLKFVIIEFKRIFVIIVNVYVLLTILILLKRLVYVFVNNL